MNKRKKFPIRKKPKLSAFHDKAVEEAIAYDYGSTTAGSLIELLKTFDPETKIELDLDYSDCYYESDIPSIKLLAIRRVPQEEEFAKAMKNYNKWYTTNKDKIHAELALREKEKK
jgi:hypothetical protein